MHEVLYKIAAKVQITIDLCHGGVGSDKRRIMDTGELFTYYVASD